MVDRADNTDSNNISARRQRKQAKKKLALQRRFERLNNRGPPTSFVGQHKWLGGAVDPQTGYIYGVPSHSYQIICIKPSTPTTKAEIFTIPLPNEFQQGKFKWLRGLVYDGSLYAIPAWSKQGVLKCHLATQKVTVLPLPHKPSHYETPSIPWKSFSTNVDRGRWMWHGGALGESSSGEFAIYCPPSNAQHVLKVNLDGSDKVEEIGPKLSEGQNKWYGGIKGLDGCVYGMPYNATGVLRINPKDDSVEVLGNYPRGGYKWHGGLLAPQTGIIYAFPAHSNEVLCVDTNVREDSTGDESWRVNTIPIKRHEGDTDPPDLSYKWLGGSYGADSCIYGMPSDATSILRIDPFKNEATTFGKVSSTRNKFQGGVLSSVDKCVYAVAADADCILKIDTDPNTPLTLDLIGKDFEDVDDKWQGGFVGRDNKIYAIPENITKVMVITPGVTPRVEMLT
eukprot:scaffold1118_cov150-Skeletonema_menzelii.AAC.29